MCWEIWKTTDTLQLATKFFVFFSLVENPICQDLFVCSFFSVVRVVLPFLQHTYLSSLIHLISIYSGIANSPDIPDSVFKIRIPDFCLNIGAARISDTGLLYLVSIVPSTVLHSPLSWYSLFYADHSEETLSPFTQLFFTIHCFL